MHFNFQTVVDLSRRRAVLGANHPDGVRPVLCHLYHTQEYLHIARLIGPSFLGMQSL